MTDTELDAIEARCNAATPGPWSIHTGCSITIPKSDAEALIAEVRCRGADRRGRACRTRRKHIGNRNDQCISQSLRSGLRADHGTGED